MKMPNGYGGVEKLKGNRRKPYAVKISYLEKQDDGTVKRKRKYVAYFSKPEQAYAYLADLNQGCVIKEHIKYTDIYSFAELYEKWKTFRKSLKKKLAEKTWRNYDIAFERFGAIHDRKITSLRASDVQTIITANNSKAESTISNMRSVLNQMWAYALSNDLVTSDITTGLIYEFTNPEEQLHTRFTDNEIKLLWRELWTINNIDIVLIYIYTGVRPSELLEIESENVHLQDRYMVGGMKTDAGRNRIIPIHEKIVPLIEYRLSQNRKFLITNKYGNQYTYGVYHASNWTTLMNKLNFNHAPHDCRYTFASLADDASMNEICRKIIMGHAVPNKDGTAYKTGNKKDITQGIYTEKTIKDLVAEVNKIEIPAL